MKTKFFASLLALAVVLLIFLNACGGDLIFGTVPVLMNTATLGEIQGTVQIKNPGQEDFSAASNGDTLQVLGQIRTGSDGHLRLDLSTGTIVRVASDSLFTLEANEQQDGSLFTRLVMQAGQVWINLNGGQVEVETASGEASVRGSYMSVWVDPETEDVWVTCLEGWCQAKNPTAVIDMVAGQGCMLFKFDPQGTIPPPPPQLRYLDQQDIDEFLTNNPEANEIMNAVIATASALPPLAPPPTPEPVEACFELGLPENGSQVAGEGLIQFDWTDQPEVYKYVITITKPNQAERSWIAWQSSFQIDALDLPLEGTYSWSVTAYDTNIQPLCTSGPWTFSKPVSEPVPVADCFELIDPAEAAELPETGPITFTWQEQPGRYKYIIVITKPDGSEFSKIVWTNSYTLPAEKLTQGGAYQWQVTAYDSNIRPMCTSGPRTFTKPGSTPPEGNGCVALLTPANGVELDADGPVEFTWSAHPQAYKYIITFKMPNGFSDSLIAWTPFHLRYMGSLPESGTYEWWITVKDGNLHAVCSSDHFTFTKAQGTMPTKKPGEGGNETGSPSFWGHTVILTECSLKAMANTDYAGGVKKFTLSLDPNPPATPYVTLDNIEGSLYKRIFNICDLLGNVPAGTTVYWRFEIFDGVYLQDNVVGSFVTAQNCP